MMANAQIQDGRDFSMDGFAAYEGVAGTCKTILKLNYCTIEDTIGVG